MKKITFLSIILIGVMMATILVNGCAVSETITAKSGSQLWGETCIRCHNAPSSDDYSGAQWEAIGMHMKLRANLTDDEANKIIAYLKSAN